MMQSMLPELLSNLVGAFDLPCSAAAQIAIPLVSLVLFGVATNLFHRVQRRIVARDCHTVDANWARVDNQCENYRKRFGSVDWTSLRNRFPQHYQHQCEAERAESAEFEASARHLVAQSRRLLPLIVGSCDAERTLYDAPPPASDKDTADRCDGAGDGGAAPLRKADDERNRYHELVLAIAGRLLSLVGCVAIFSSLALLLFASSDPAVVSVG